MEYVVVAWIICGVLGAIIGSSKNAAGIGFMLGVLFGPLGVIAAFATDGRDKCSKCQGRLNGKPEICPHCGTKLDWQQPLGNVFANVAIVAGRQVIRYSCPRCKTLGSYPIGSAGTVVNCISCSGPMMLPPLPPPPAPPQQANPRLRSCPDCGKQASKRATTCPSCGCPLDVIP